MSSEPVYFSGQNWQIQQGDALEELSNLPDCCIDAIVTDPPYGLSKEPDVKAMLTQWLEQGFATPKSRRGFMGKEWDASVPQPLLWEQALRVLKPGGHLVAFAGARTFDLMGISLRFAGFEIRDVLMWLYSSAMPKSVNISKDIDKALGAKRTKVRIPARKESSGWVKGAVTRPWMEKAREQGYHELDSDDPATEEAARWFGYGTALKPAVEPVVLARKSLEGTLANNVLTYGTGVLAIDDCRVPYLDDADRAAMSGRKIHEFGTGKGLSLRLNSGPATEVVRETSDAGRWPSNVVTDGSVEVGELLGSDGRPRARFFFSAKASKKDRDFASAGNTHPTVKPVALMDWLIRLVLPVCDEHSPRVIVDPFCGSGTTGKAAILMRNPHLHFIGVEQSSEYCTIAASRLKEADAM